MKKVYKINKFEQPQKKDYKDVQKYDVARFEYGDFDNWVDAIILDIKRDETDFNGNPRTSTVLAIHFAYEWGMEETCYSFDTDLDIIGTAEKLEEEQTKNESEGSMSM